MRWMATMRKKTTRPQEPHRTHLVHNYRAYHVCKRLPILLDPRPPLRRPCSLPTPPTPNSQPPPPPPPLPPPPLPPPASPSTNPTHCSSRGTRCPAAGTSPFAAASAPSTPCLLPPASRPTPSPPPST